MMKMIFFCTLLGCLSENLCLTQVCLVPVSWVSWEKCCCKREDGKGQKRKGLILFWNTTVELRDPWDLIVLLWNYVKLIFCLLVQWEPLAMALTWKAINKEIAYSIASVLISSFETWTHFLPLPWVVCVCMCRYQALGKVCSLSLQRMGGNRVIFLLIFWLVTLLGLSAAQMMCRFISKGSHIHEKRKCLSRKTLSKVSDLKLLIALWFLLEVVGWKYPFQRDNHVQVQGCFCSIIPLNYHSWKGLEIVFRLKFKSARIRTEVKKYFL